MAKTKISGIPTFSVNNTENLYSDRVNSLVSQLQQGKQVHADYLTDMYLKIVDKNEAITDITEYSKKMDKLVRLKRSKTSTVALLTDSELQRGYKGVSEVDLNLDYDSVNNVLTRPALVQQFLDIRENLYYSYGVDIYRLLELILEGDMKAVHKIDLVAYEYPQLKTFLFEILTTPDILQDIQEILA